MPFRAVFGEELNLGDYITKADRGGGLVLQSVAGAGQAGVLATGNEITKLILIEFVFEFGISGLSLNWFWARFALPTGGEARCPALPGSWKDYGRVLQQLVCKYLRVQ